MTTAVRPKDGGEPLDWFGPLFGRAWDRKPLDLTSDRVKTLAATGLLNPRSLKQAEIQELAAAVLAHLAANPE